MVPTPVMLASDWGQGALLITVCFAAAGSIFYLPILWISMWKARRIAKEFPGVVVGNAQGWALAVLWGLFFPPVHVLLIWRTNDQWPPLITSMISVLVLMAATRSWIPAYGIVVATGGLFASGLLNPDPMGSALALLVWNGALAVSLLIWLSREHRRALAMVGRCVKCGYDLRDLPEPVCPECGPLPAPPAA
jgi:hypothetical protein